MTLHVREHLEARNRGEAKALGLPWNGTPYGVLLCIDDNGGLVTTVTEDITYHRMVVAAGNDALAGLSLPPSVYTRSRPGWPGEPGWSPKATYRPTM